MDNCRQCIKYKSFLKGICGQCGAFEVEVILEGCCLVEKCLNCGFSYIGGSFFAPCEVDDNEYILTIAADACLNYVVAEIGKAAKINLLTLRKAMNSGQPLPKTFPLKQIMEIESILKRYNITFSVEPSPEYEKYYECKNQSVIR